MIASIVKEYRLDKDFVVKTQRVHEPIEVPRVLYNQKEDKMEHKLLANYKEYHSFKSLEYQSKILIENNLFDLMELVEIFYNFGLNRLKNEYTFDDILIKINKKTDPYTLKIIGESFEINLAAEQCLNTVLKLRKMVHQLDPIPTEL
jgi:hypothetical protein